MSRRRITVDSIARVEGEGALDLTIEDGRITALALSIFEAPRFFEALLVGRDHREAPDLTARICGICPVAYQMSAVHAIERGAGVTLPPTLRALRRLLYCGEWIESHTLHVHLLHAPDFLGLPDVMALAQQAPEAVRRGLELKRAGNALVTLLGGREIHPVNVRVGGFHRLPRRAELAAQREALLRARDLALEVVRWVATLDVPEHRIDAPLVALRHPDEYPMNEGRIASTGGLDVAPEAFEEVMEERQVPHSTALQAVLRGEGVYLTGPLARHALNRARLTPLALEAAEAVGLEPGCRNPFRSILVRAVEVLHACDEAVAILARDDLDLDGPAAVPVAPPARGCAATEAPRGLLYHRYDLAPDGLLAAARIVPPTSQNQAAIEDDLRRCLAPRVTEDDEALAALAERIVRNHDPCISCATHFLKVRVDRR